MALPVGPLSVRNHAFIRISLFILVLFFFSFGSSKVDRLEVDETTRHCYEQKVGAWLAVEAIVQQMAKEKAAEIMAKHSSGSVEKNNVVELDGDIDNDVFVENGFSDLSDPDDFDEEQYEQEKIIEKPNRLNKTSTDSGNVADEDVALAKTDDGVVEVPLNSIRGPECSDLECGVEKSLQGADCKASGHVGEPLVPSEKSSPSTSSYETVANDFNDMVEPFGDETQSDLNDGLITTISSANQHSVFITNASVDIINGGPDDDVAGDDTKSELTPLLEEVAALDVLETLQEPSTACPSPAGSLGGGYPVSDHLNVGFVFI